MPTSYSAHIRKRGSAFVLSRSRQVRFKPKPRRGAILRAAPHACLAVLAAGAISAMPALAQELPPSPAPGVHPLMPSGIATTSSIQSTGSVLDALNSIAYSAEPQIPTSTQPSAGDIQRAIDALLQRLIVTLNQSVAQQQALIFRVAFGPPAQRASAAAQLAAVNKKIALLQEIITAFLEGRKNLANLSVKQLQAIVQKLQMLDIIGAPTNPTLTGGGPNSSLKAAMQELLQQMQKIQQAEAPGAHPFAPETSLADLPAFEAMAYATRERPTSRGGAWVDLSPGPDWLAWSQATGTSTDFGGPAPASGSTGQVIGGIEHRFAPLLTVGAVLGAERSRFNTQYNGGYFNGSGTMIAPYVRFQVTPNVKLNVLGGASFLTMDLYDGAQTARFDATRPFVSASLLGTWYYGALRFSPSASVIFGELRSDAAITSNGNLLAAANTRFGRVSAGPELGYSLPYTYGTIEPFAFAAFERDFGDTSNIVAANGTIFAPGTQGAKAGGGLKIASFYGWSGVASASYNSIGWRGQNSWTGSARLEWKF